MLIYLTGVSGSGKSAVCAELVRSGYDARDADEEISGWFRRADGVEVLAPQTAGYRTPAWYTVNEWRYSVARAERFAADVRGGVGFLCGCGANENEIWHLLDRAFFLEVDETTLRERLAIRTGNDFGKTEYELANILGWHAAMAENCRKFGIQPLDATRPVGQIVAELLSLCGVGASRPTAR